MVDPGKPEDTRTMVPRVPPRIPIMIRLGPVRINITSAPIEMFPTSEGVVGSET